MKLFYDDPREGHINPQPRPRLVTETPVSCLLDGDGGFGAIVASRAMGECIARAQRHGVGIASVRNSSHAFYPGYYAQLAIESGLIGFFTTTSKPALAPGGLRPALLGQNPISFGIPALNRAPILLDIGLGASGAKIRQAASEGQSIPVGWALDAAGKPTTDASIALNDLRINPIGGHKGFGIALVMDALAAGLSGAPSAREAGAHGKVGHFMWCLDPAMFGDPAAFAQRIDGLLEQVTRDMSPDEMLYPGERGARLRAEAIAEGEVWLPPMTVAAIREMGDKLGVAVPTMR